MQSSLERIEPAGPEPITIKSKVIFFLYYILTNLLNIKEQKKIFEDLTNEIGEKYVLDNLLDTNIGNSKYFFKYKKINLLMEVKIFTLNGYMI